MFRAFITRTTPIVVGTSFFAALNSKASLDTPSIEEKCIEVNKEILKFSSYKTLEELRIANEKRRNESDCAFCAWMAAGPCGDTFKDWDNCVNETKASKGENADFVSMCTPFTQQMMNCINKHPEYYEELAQVQAKASKDKAEKEARQQAQATNDEWDWKNEVSDYLVKGPVYSLQSPGDMAGKEAKHIPKVNIINKQKMNIIVNHGMTPEHFIEYIWARDDNTGSIISIIKLTPESKPELSFEIPPNVKSVTCFEKCNLHGVWKSDAQLIA